MHKIIVPSLLLITFFSPAFAQQKSDRELEGLNGPVQTVSAEKIDYSDPHDIGKREGHRQTLDTVTFDERGNQTKRVIYDDYGFLVGTQIYKYDAAGRLAEESLSDEHNSPLSRDIYSYDSRSKLASKVSYEGGNPDALRQTYSYDPRGSVSEEALSYKNEPAGKTVFKYDDRGRLIEVAFYDSKGERGAAPVGPCFGAHKLIYKYDEQGRVVEEQAFETDGSLKRKTTYTYDIKGNVLEESRTDSYGSTRFNHSYEFDARGNWVKRETRIVHKSLLSVTGLPDGYERVQIVRRTITYF